ncbi:MAG: hypothetical protein IAG10_29310 [Planctomycetaceae bacterium]|nr:hypothetical protein [Planctomycetaceae bacterium]
MSRRHRNNTAKVSLFPFLDVLVCTMGSLILLLLVATSRIRAAAVERAKQAAMQERLKSEEPPTPVPVPIVVATEPEPEDDPTPEWQTRVEQLTEERDSLRNQLSQMKNRLATAQSAVMRTKVKAASTEDRLKEIRTQQAEAASERQRLQAEIDSLQSDLTDAELRLAKAAERQKTAKSKFAFLPFDGRTGTTKRPILIECTQEHIRFLPEDVRLTPAELNGFTSGFNPLLIASRELVHYWKAYERVHSADADPTKDADSFETDLAVLNDKEREPYVLLLVRPNGAVAFHIAKGFLSQLKVPHGYELVTDDMEIDSSNPDPEAKKICQAAVTQVLSERDKLLLALTRNRDQQRDQLQLDPDARTFVPTETGDSPTGFNRPKSGASSKPSTSNGAAASPKTNRLTAAPQSNGQGGGGSSAPVASGTDDVPRTGGLTPPARQQRAGGSQVAQADRPQPNDEPSEEPLPQSNARRYENDDSKPFPFNGERTKPAPSKNGVPGANATKPNAPRTNSKPNNDPRAANNSTNGSANNGNLARMKRRYLMPRSGIGLEKVIPIRISSKRVVIGGEYEIPVEAGVKTESLIDRVLIAMDRVQSGWPSAGEGYHWVPTIKYEVVPGGEQTHQRLNSALFDLGLQSNVEYLDSDVGQAASLPAQKRQAGSLLNGGGGAR